MARASAIITSVNSGEISPLLAGRPDQKKYHSSGETVENWVLRTQGAMSKRPGLQYIASVKTHSKKVRLIPFEFNVTQAYVLEFGDTYIRFYKDKGQIVSGPVPYEIVSPWTEAQLPDIQYIQSADVMYLMHPEVPVHTLTRTGHTAWVLNEYDLVDGPYLPQNTTGITLAPSAASGNITITATPVVGAEMVTAGDFAAAGPWVYGAGWAHDAVNLEADHTPGNTAALEQAIAPTAAKSYLLTYTIANCTVGSLVPQIGGVNGVTRVADGTFVEVITATGTGNLKFTPTTTFDGSVDDVSVKETSGLTDVFQPTHVGSYWRILHGATWGYAEVTAYISGVQVSAAVRSNFGGVGAVTTWREGAFSGYRGYPRCGCFYEERLYFGGTSNNPQTIWGSKSSDFLNFAPEATITDAGPVTYSMAANQMNVIRWMMATRLLIFGTAGGEWKFCASNVNEVVTPTSVSARLESNYGSAALMPAQVGNVILFVQVHGRKVRELLYSYADDAYVAGDLTVFSEHVTSPAIIEMAYQKEPDQTLWAVRSDGVLLSMIYERNQEVVGWTRHVTDGAVESVACIPGANQTEVWAAVQRTVGGAVKRYVECLADVNFGSDQEDAFLVDSGLTYDGAATDTITGLAHLEGKTVTVMADGATHPTRVVSGGGITLEYEASVVQVGLPYTATFLSTRLEAGAEDGTAQGKLKRIDEVVLRLYRSMGGRIGCDADHLEYLVYRETGDAMTTPAPLFTGDLPVEYQGDYDLPGQVRIVHEEPQPFTVTGLVVRMTTFEG